MDKYTITDSTQGECIITNLPGDCMITSTLRIADCVPSDSGEYVCTATNAIGNETTTLSLIVHGKYPVIKQ